MNIIPLILIPLMLAACGQKGDLLRPSEIKAKQEAEARKAAEKEANGSF